MSFRALCCGLAFGMAASSAVACDYPPLVIIPAAEDARGREAEIRDEVTAYHESMEEYTACVRAEHDQADAEGAPDLVKRLLIARNNAAVAEVEAVLDQFDALLEALSGGED